METIEVRLLWSFDMHFLSTVNPCNCPGTVDAAQCHLQPSFPLIADGSSDEIDIPLRHLFADQELVKSHSLMSLNSVNWSRIMIQLAHFIYAYLKMSGLEQTVTGAPLPVLEVVVPTGGAGNIAGEKH